MIDSVIIIFIIICVLIIPWFVNWIVLNDRNKKVSIWKSPRYFEKILDIKEKIFWLIAEFSLIFVFLYSYIIFNQIYILIIGFIAIFFVNYAFKRSFIVKKSKNCQESYNYKLTNKE